MKCKKQIEMCRTCDEFGSTCAQMQGIERKETERLKSELEDAARMLLENGIITQSRAAEMMGLNVIQMREKCCQWVGRQPTAMEEGGE